MEFGNLKGTRSESLRDALRQIGFGPSQRVRFRRGHDTGHTAVSAVDTGRWRLVLGGSSRAAVWWVLVLSPRVSTAAPIRGFAVVTDYRTWEEGYRGECSEQSVLWPLVIGCAAMSEPEPTTDHDSVTSICH